MSAANLADRIRMNRRSRSPVQDTVDKLYDDINDAITRGSSFRDIHAQLTREGHQLGKGHTSLFAAFKVVKARREQALVSTEARTASTSHNVPVSAGTMTPETAALGQMPTGVIDTRRKIDEW